jgi:hypothetical protein
MYMILYVTEETKYMDVRCIQKQKVYFKEINEGYMNVLLEMQKQNSQEL